MEIMRCLLSLAFGSAGMLHFVNGRQFRSIVSEYLPLRRTAVLVTDVFEVFFRVMLLAKRPADWLKKGINTLSLTVLSANIYIVRKQLPLGDKFVPK